MNYIGSRPAEFASGPPPYVPGTQRVWMPGYTQFNLRTGARSQSWLVNLYVNNVGNRRGVVGYDGFGGNLGNTGGVLVTVIQPRTIGFGVSHNF